MPSKIIHCRDHFASGHSAIRDATQFDSGVRCPGGSATQYQTGTLFPGNLEEECANTEGLHCEYLQVALVSESALTVDP
eukprot:1137464-Pelagomonas_calceolata.AAC.2